MVMKIDNGLARRLWLNSHGLSAAPTGAVDVLEIIKKLGFVQLDTIQNVVRAHHHILWSRNQNYREPMMDELLGQKRAIFEHFTHDASVLPIDSYPMWKRQFRRLGDQARRSKYYRDILNEAGLADIKERITKEGPLSTHAFESQLIKKKGIWTRPPHKKALDYMWYCGELSTSHREKFKKFYDLSERVIPQSQYEQEHSDEDQIDWLCHQALDRLNFGTIGEIQRFWDAVDGKEARAWAEQKNKQLIAVKIQTVDGGWIEGFAPEIIEERSSNISNSTSRMRIINPFDPAIRDRSRLSRLFGFDYKNEIFVPAAKRQWGYYVYPILEGDRFVGRLEMKADRKAATLNVLNFWREKDVKWTSRRSDKLDAELDRMMRFADLNCVNWVCSRHH